MTIEDIPLSIKPDNKPDVCVLLDSLFNVLNVKLTKGESSCKCEVKSDTCFDCLRLEAEELLTDDLTLDGLDDSELEEFSNTFESELDKRIATMIKLHKEKI